MQAERAEPVQNAKQKNKQVGLRLVFLTQSFQQLCGLVLQYLPTPLRLSIPRFPPFVHPMLGTRFPARNQTFQQHYNHSVSGGLDVNPARSFPRAGSPFQSCGQYVNTAQHDLPGSPMPGFTFRT